MDALNHILALATSKSTGANTSSSTSAISTIPVHIDSTTTLPIYQNNRRIVATAIEKRDYETLYHERLLTALLQSDTYMTHAATALAKNKSKNTNTIKSKSKSKSKSSSTISPRSSKSCKSSKSSKSSSKINHEKIKQGVISKMLSEYPFNLFNFQSRDECKSKSTSKSYYISKTTLVDIIASNPDLAGVFPKGYKKLPKETICDTLFDKHSIQKQPNS